MKIMLVVFLLMGDGEVKVQQAEIFTSVGTCNVIAPDVAETVYEEETNAVDYEYVCAPLERKV